MIFGHFVRRKRMSKGITQQECAYAIGCEHRSSYHRKETGAREWSLIDVMGIAGLFGQRASELLAEYEQITVKGQNLSD